MSAVSSTPLQSSLPPVAYVLIYHGDVDAAVDDGGESGDVVVVDVFLVLQFC